MLEQIKKLQDEKLDIQDIENEIDTSKNEEEFSHLRVHNQSLLTQIKKLKNYKRWIIPGPKGAQEISFVGDYD